MKVTNSNTKHHSSFHVLLGFIGQIIGLLTGSSMGVMTNYMSTEKVLLKSTYRYWSAVPFSLILAILESVIT